jgi:rubrerythrin
MIQVFFRRKNPQRISSKPKEKNMSSPSLLDAIAVVKENERLASESYADAAQKISNPSGKMVFEELSAFERYHYDQLTALEKSLQETGAYLDYQAREFPTPPIFEIKAAQEPNIKSVMRILTEAMALEKEAEKTYAEMAIQTADPLGYEMFMRLSDEEHGHNRILSDAYWTLTNLGSWKWSNPR